MAQIQPGTYPCVVKSSVLIPPKEQGAQYQIAVQVGVDVPCEGGGTESVDWTYFASFSDNSYPTFIEKMLKELGWDPAEHNYAFDELNAGDNSPLVGREAKAVFQMDTYNGQSKIKLRFLNGTRGAFVPKEQMAPADAKAFAATMRARLIAKNGPASRQAASRAPAQCPAPGRTASAPVPVGGVTDSVRKAATTEVFPGEFDPPPF